MKLKKIIACVLAAACLTLAAGCGDKTTSDSSKTDNSSADIVEISGNIGETVLQSGDKIAVFEIEGYGTIKAKLLPDVAPKGVENFIKLADSGFYDGLTIHRVIADFMLQGGSLNGDGTGGASADGGEFSCEINTSMRHYYGALCYANAGGSNTCQFYIVNNKEPQTDVSNVYDQYADYYSQYAEMYTSEAKNYQDNAEYYEYLTSSGKAYKNMSDGAKAMSETLTDEISAKYAEVGGVPFLDGGYTVFGQTVEGFDVIDAISAVETEMGSDGAESKPVTDIIISSVTIHTAE